MDICTLYYFVRLAVPVDVVEMAAVAAAAAMFLLAIALLLLSPKYALAGGYATQLKHKAYRLLHTDEPSPTEVADTQHALSRFPEDEVASEFERRLAGRPPAVPAAEPSYPEDTGFYYHPLSLPPIYYQR